MRKRKKDTSMQPKKRWKRKQMPAENASKTKRTQQIRRVKFDPTKPKSHQKSKRRSRQDATIEKHAPENRFHRDGQQNGNRFSI